MKLTAEHILELLDSLSKEVVFDYVSSKTSKVALKSVDMTEKTATIIKYTKNDQSGKETKFTSRIFEILENNVIENKPFSVDVVLKNSGSDRSALEALIIRTSEFYACKVGANKNVVWVPSDPHETDQAITWEESHMTQPSPEELKQAFYRYLTEEGRLKEPSTGQKYWSVITSDRDEIQFVKDIIAEVTSGRTTDLFSVYDNSEAIQIWKKAIPDQRNKKFQHSVVSAVLGKYADFLKGYSSSKDLVLPGSENPLQIIYFGAPGTGKSYKIKHEIIPADIEPYRVTFYPDYYYSDFVGGLRPQKTDKGISYEFEPGPFAKALKDSFSKPTYLIIEEINRGNAAAIFGDIFQLLDRKEGKSEYSITNHDLYQYLTKEGVTELVEDKVYLPSNLNILCTMNTADQNVFVLDTAFKRRFRMEYVPINFNSYYIDNKTGNGVKPECSGYLKNTSVFDGANYQDIQQVIKDQDIYKSIIRSVKVPRRDWPTFASYINARIDYINNAEQKISEDKKLGPFFVNPDELNDRKAFADKVLYYLKQDVFKYEDSILAESYEVLYDSFVNNKEDIFTII